MLKKCHTFTSWELSLLEAHKVQQTWQEKEVIIILSFEAIATQKLLTFKYSTSVKSFLEQTTVTDLVELSTGPDIVEAS